MQMVLELRLGDEYKEIINNQLVNQIIALFYSSNFMQNSGNHIEYRRLFIE